MNSKKNIEYRLSPDESAYVRDLFTENKGLIQNAVKSVLKSRFAEFGEDCIGEVCLLIVQNVKILMSHDNPQGWLVIASKKTAANYIRKEYTRLKNAGNEVFCDIPTDSETVHEDALYEIWMKDNSIERLLCELTEREREVYELLYIKRMTAVSASRLLGISDSTVRSIDGAIKEKIKYAVRNKLL